MGEHEWALEVLRPGQMAGLPAGPCFQLNHRPHASNCCSGSYQFPSTETRCDYRCRPALSTYATHGRPPAVAGPCSSRLAPNDTSALEKSETRSGDGSRNGPFFQPRFYIPLTLSLSLSSPLHNRRNIARVLARIHQTTHFSHLCTLYPTASPAVMDTYSRSRGLRLWYRQGHEAAPEHPGRDLVDD